MCGSRARARSLADYQRRPVERGRSITFPTSPILSSYRVRRENTRYKLKFGEVSAGYPAVMAAGSQGRTGYLVVALLAGGGLYVVNRAPGWADLGLFTADVEPLIAYLNGFLAIAFVANLVFAFADVPRLRGFAGLVLAGLGGWIAYQLLSVFPFTFGSAVSVVSIAAKAVLAFALIGAVLLAIVSARRLAQG